MPDGTRFFLGYGERLTQRIAPPGGGGGTDPAYSFADAVRRLAPMVSTTSETLESLPALACPSDEAVGVVTLHPQWMAKSYHPQQLLNSYDLRQVGSRPVAVRPERWTRQGDPESMASTELYIAGNRESFHRWAEDLEEAPTRVSPQIRRLEQVRAPVPLERFRGAADREHADEPILLEVVLHAAEDVQDHYILAGFRAYAASLGARADLDRRLHAGGLCFLPVEAMTEMVDDLAEFAFLRVARPMPRLRGFPGMERSIPSPSLAPAELPSEDAIDPDLRIAVFDGGLDPATPLRRWAVSHDGRDVGVGSPPNFAHGHDVTSALLFGPLVPGQAAPRPPAVVDHYRVLDKDAESDPYELYDTLRRIDDILRTRRHELFNLSIGPVLPVEDDEVHPWTAVLDQHLSDGHALASFAVGNTGLQDAASRENRIQVPADCVNGLSVGAANSMHSDWARAEYSSVGPGRSPGVVKPDVLQFGGDGRELFLVYDSVNAPSLAHTAGTSFASPAALRLAAEVRAHFGGRISSLALKSLLVHTADPAEHDRSEVGWGRLPSDVTSIAVCEDGMVRVIFQGELSPSQYLRAPIPLPDDELVGMVSIEATFCYASQTDPQDPGSYTRSGLEVTFRPHVNRFSSDEATVAKSASFFKHGDFETEQAMRADAQKWETTLNAKRRLQPRSLNAPVFDIHYNARSSGGAARDAEKIRYALVVTVRAPRVPDLYDRVVRAYSGQLEVLVPLINIPVRV